MSSDTIHVYDTWVTGKKGRIHFDVMTKDETTALKLAKEYLVSIGEPEVPVTVRGHRRTPVRPSASAHGSMFCTERNRFPGSYRRLTSRSRAYASVPYAARTRPGSSSKPMWLTHTPPELVCT